MSYEFRFTFPHVYQIFKKMSPNILWIVSSIRNHYMANQLKGSP